MTPCRVCAAAVESLLDLGPQPISHRYLEAQDAPEFTHPLRVGQCVGCALVQLVDPVDADALRPRVPWIRYWEPEGHLDALADELAGLGGLREDSPLVGASAKDDSLLERLRARRRGRPWRADPAKEWSVGEGVGVETVQDRFTPAWARSLAGRMGGAGLVIARHILEHAHRPAEFMRAVGELVAPAGHAVFEAPDCAGALDRRDYTTLWEDHVVYFTPATFASTLARGGFEVVRFRSVPYTLENSLIAVVRRRPDVVPPAVDLAEERARAGRFAGGLEPARAAWRRALRRIVRDEGAVALLGAGHMAAAFLNLLRLADLVAFVADDDPHKQGLHMPGSRLPIYPSAALLEEGRGVRLCLLTINPEAEDRVIERNRAFIDAGGRFASIFPASRYAFDPSREGRGA